MMSDFGTIYVYGDSIMKATCPDEDMRYHFHIDEFLKGFKELPVKIINRAKFGASIEKGNAILDRDLEQGLQCKYALVEYGGNDCNFNWQEVAENPDGEHLPKTCLDRFVSVLDGMVKKIKGTGATPVLMTLPPIDSEKYLGYITRNGISRDNIVKWLGDVDRIYRYQEYYSNAILNYAMSSGNPVIDMRSEILPRKDFKSLISKDGIHPSEKGYRIIFEKLFDVLKKQILVAA